MLSESFMEKLRYAIASNRACRKHRSDVERAAIWLRQLTDEEFDRREAEEGKMTGERAEIGEDRPREKAKSPYADIVGRRGLRGVPQCGPTLPPPQESAAKFDAGKIRYDLVPPDVIEGLAAVLTHGANKYAPRDWEKGMDWGRCYAAAQRHLNAFWSGELMDGESGLWHLHHAICNLAFLAHYAKYPQYKPFDDRSKPQDNEPF